MARSGVFVCLFLAAFVGEFCLGHEEEVAKCIDGPYHKEKPSPEGPDYVECQPWKERTCCTAGFTAQLEKSNVEVLYNFSWHHCGNLSKVRTSISICLITTNHYFCVSFVRIASYVIFTFRKHCSLIIDVQSL